jgi:hypothetical protein
MQASTCNSSKIHEFFLSTETIGNIPTAINIKTTIEILRVVLYNKQ